VRAPTARRPSLLLELDLTEPPVTGGAEHPLARLRPRGRPELQHALRALHEAGADPRVAGLVVKVGGALPWALMHELRRGVAAFRSHGKPALAWAESFGEGPAGTSAYVLASAFEEIWCQPGGSLGPLGVGVETTFLRGLLDRAGVEPQLEQRHEFKNAGDRLMRTGFTEAHRASLERLAESVFEDAVAAIGEGRRLDAERVRALVDAAPFTAAAALEAGLVDRLGYRDEAYAEMRSRAGEDATLLFADLWRPRRGPLRRRRRGGHVALVEVTGTIATGRTRRGGFGRVVGSDSVGSALRAAARDARARAVVLRVDSRGGSAVASEAIWREVGRLREAGKPVVVSMGQVAASGGYYVACPADVVVALPSTITGSIGVLGGKLVVGELLERLGLTTGTVSRGEHALMYSPRRGFTEDERARLGALLDAVYEDFVAKVAAGRRRPTADIEAVARGRVWTGSDALRRGLVDELGGLHDAARIARAHAGLPPDAPLRPAASVTPLARLRRPRNSDDPRVATTAGLPGLRDLASALDLPPAALLQMPDVTLT
jgi:protease-4